MPEMILACAAQQGLFFHSAVSRPEEETWKILSGGALRCVGRVPSTLYLGRSCRESVAFAVAEKDAGQQRRIIKQCRYVVCVCRGGEAM